MKKNKGFTLVEVIVILVILAILAAVLIPSLTTYIDKAREKTIAANARGAYVATQALLSEKYGTSATFVASGSVGTDGTVTKGTLVIDDDDILELAQLDGFDTDPTIAYAYDDAATITGFNYTQDKKIAIWDSSTGAWNIDDVASSGT